jgi:hypothetical protein
VLSFSEQARREAAKAGVRLPCDPDSVDLALRQRIARKLGGKRYNVDVALAAGSGRKRPNRSPAEVAATDSVVLAEKKARRLLAAEAQRNAKVEARESKAAKRQAEAAERERQRAIDQALKRPKKPAGSVLYEFSSQKLPQLPAFRAPQWMFDAVEKARRGGSRATVIRWAVSAGFRSHLRVQPVDLEGDGIQIGSTRLRKDDLVLLKALKKHAKANSVTLSDVIRWAVARWLEQNGYTRGK